MLLSLLQLLQEAEVITNIAKARKLPITGKTQYSMTTNNTYLDALDLMDRDDLVKMVKTMITGGIVLNFHGKRTAQEIDKKVRPRQTLIKKELCVGSPEDQARNVLIEGENLQAMVTLYK